MMGANLCGAALQRVRVWRPVQRGDVGLSVPGVGV